MHTLDLLITSYPGLYTTVESSASLSDHDIVFATLKCRPPRRKKPERTFLQFSKGNYSKMRQETTEFSKEKYFNGHQSSRSVEENWVLIKNFLTKTTSENIPSKKASSRESLPWVTKAIKALIRKKDRTHAQYKKTRSTRLEKKWKDERRQVKKDIDEAHDKHVNNLIGDIHKDSKPFWKYINCQKADKQGIPPLTTKDNKVAETDQEKAEALNTQFTSVFTTTEYNEVPYKPPTVHMRPILITNKGVKKILNGLNSSKAMGPDAVHPRILKELAHELSGILTHFFQQSIDTGTVPKDWKDANICPLFKKNDRSLPSNYRPVSLTCILCKVLEHIVSSNLMSHFDNNNILHNRQHAFRKGHSCESQLINVIHDWATSIDNRQQTDIFILDFEKAFDTVPHELLKSKLHGYGVNKSTMNWIDSFLSDRQQSVVVNGAACSK